MNGSEVPPYEERPRSSGMSPWLIVAIVLGVLVVLGGLVGVVMIALLVPAVQRVREAADRTQRMNDLKAIGLSFHSVMDEKKRGPAGVDELVSFLGPASREEARLRKGEITMIWNAARAVDQPDNS